MGFFTSQKGLRSAGGPKSLKWGLPGRGSNLLKIKSRRPLTSSTPGCNNRHPCHRLLHASLHCHARSGGYGVPNRLQGPRDDHVTVAAARWAEYVAIHGCGRAAVVEEEEAQPHSAPDLVAGDARQPGRDAERGEAVRPRWRAGWQRPLSTVLFETGRTLLYRFETGSISSVQRNGLAQAEVGHGRARSVCRAVERAEGFLFCPQIAPGSGKSLDAQLTELQKEWPHAGSRYGARVGGADCNVFRV